MIPSYILLRQQVGKSQYELHDKFNVYRRNRVREYAVWRVYDCLVDWWE